jgi:SAM-dependent methyltransferase
MGRLTNMLPPRIRGHARRARQALRLRLRPWTHRGRARDCPLCGHQYRIFLADGVIGTADTVCPACLSLPRHRALWALIARCHDEGRIALRGRLLHVAPEACLAHALRRDVDYLSIDLEPGVAMQMGDVTRLDFPDAHFDVVLCNHVLEHVRDDRAALAEIHRVLRPGGWASLLVPLGAGPTRESPADATPEYLLAHHGQRDHVRTYGDDYRARLEAAGFHVEWARADELLGPETLRRQSVEPGRPIYLAIKGRP